MEKSNVARMQSWASFASGKVFGEVARQDERLLPVFRLARSSKETPLHDGGLTPNWPREDGCCATEFRPAKAMLKPFVLCAASQIGISLSRKQQSLELYALAMPLSSTAHHLRTSTESRAPPRFAPAVLFLSTAR